MNREELIELSEGTFKCYFKGEPALLVKGEDTYVYLKHNNCDYKGSGKSKAPFKYSWCIFSPYNRHVHGVLNLSEIVFDTSNVPLGEL